MSSITLRVFQPLYVNFQGSSQSGSDQMVQLSGLNAPSYPISTSSYTPVSGVSGTYWGSSLTLDPSQFGGRPFQFLTRIACSSSSNVVTYTFSDPLNPSNGSQSYANSYCTINTSSNTPGNNQIIGFDITYTNNTAQNYVQVTGLSNFVYAAVPTSGFNVVQIQDQAGFAGYINNGTSTVVGLYSGNIATRQKYFFQSPAPTSYTLVPFGSGSSNLNTPSANDSYLAEWNANSINGTLGQLTMSYMGSSLSATNITSQQTLNQTAGVAFPGSLGNFQSQMPGFITGFACIVYNSTIFSLTAVSIGSISNSYYSIQTYANGETPQNANPPTNLTISNPYTGEVVATWTASVPNTQAPITYQAVVVNATTNAAIGSQQSNLTGTSATFTGLDSYTGTSVYVQIIAFTDFGNSNFVHSSNITLATQAAIPQPPSTFTVATGSAQETVNMVIGYASDPSSYNITSFTINATNNVTNHTNSPIIPVSSMTYNSSAFTWTYTMTGIVGTNYTFSIIATNAQGSSTPPFQATPTPFAPNSVFDPPVINAVVPGVSGQILINVTIAPPGDSIPAADDLTNVTLYYYPTASTTTSTATSTSSVQSVTATPPAGTYQFTVTLNNLTNGTHYDFYVVATNQYGASPASNIVDATPVAPPALPTAPTITGVIPYNTQANVSYTLPGMSPAFVDCILSFWPLSDPSSIVYFRTTAQNFCVIYNLVPVTQYAVAMYAENSLGAGATCASFQFTTTNQAPLQTEPPPAPTITQVTAINNAAGVNIQVSFSTVPGASSYTLYFTPVNNGQAPIYNQSITVSPVIVPLSDIQTSVPYLISLFAINNVGSSTSSNVIAYNYDAATSTSTSTTYESLFGLTTQQLIEYGTGIGVATLVFGLAIYVAYHGKKKRVV